MLDWLWHSIAAQIGLAGLVIAALIAVAVFVPFARRIAIEAIVVVASAGAIYLKGVSDKRRQEKEKKDAAVKKAQDKFHKIDARPDTDADIDKRLRDGNF